MMMTMVGCIIVYRLSNIRSYRGGDHDDDDGWLYHCLTPQQHLRSYQGGDHDDADGWLYHCLPPQQPLRSYQGGDHDDDGWLYHCLKGICTSLSPA